MLITKRLGALAGATLMLLAAHASWAAELKPFVLAAKSNGDMASTVSAAKDKLTAAGFEIVGEHSPYDNADIIIVTNDALKANAAATEFGAYGAAQRVSVTKVGDEVQVAYTNPVYMANAYRMKGDMADIRQQLAAALGDQGEYGPEEGKTAEQLREYHYMFMMPYFDDQLRLAIHKDYQTALAAVEAGLAAGKYGATKVYRIDVPGKDETVFGVALKDNTGKNEVLDEAFVMSEIDFKPVKSTAHLPYDLVVKGQFVYTMPAQFRIAINFPDLPMGGPNSFLNIRNTPDAVQASLEKTAEGK